MHKKINQKYFLIILVVLFVLVAYFIFVNNKKINPIIKQIENFALYQEIVDADEVFFDKTCTNEEFNEFLRLTESGSIKVLNLLGGIQTIITPNYYHWSNEKFLGFKNAEPPAFCNVGIMGPVHAYKDYLLWSNSCGGAMPESQDPQYADFINCIDTEKIINIYFK